MKIAVATMDGTSVSQHFGQSRGFIIFDVDGGEIKSREVLTGNSTPHNDGMCDGGHKAEGGMLGMLRGCEVLICGGMGAGAANAIQQIGVRPVIVPGISAADEAVAHFVAGKVDPNAASLCNCQH
jgi:predicted Fe-Mo cluster-binding NifX family protein